MRDKDWPRHVPSGHRCACIIDGEIVNPKSTRWLILHTGRFWLLWMEPLRRHRARRSWR